MPISRPARAAGTSKLAAMSASIGDICVVMSRSPAYKHYSLADIEWMVLPAVLSGQFYVADAEHRENGFRAPIAALTWARVSEETDRRLSENIRRPIRLRPDEWACGNIWWIVAAVGESRAVADGLRHLAGTVFKERQVKVALADTQGRVRVTPIDDLIGRVAENEAGSP